MLVPQKYAIVIAPDRGPCCQVRWRQMANLLDSTAGGETYIIISDDAVFDERMLMQTSVVVFSRPSLARHAEIIEAYAALKDKYRFRLAIEFDDLLFAVDDVESIPDYNPAPINTRNITSLYKNRVLRCVDQVIVSTDFLKLAFMKEFGTEWAPRIDVLPNFAFRSLFFDLHSAHRRKKPVMLYTGSVCHYSDDNPGDFAGPWLGAIGRAVEDGIIEFHAFGESRGPMPEQTVLHSNVHASLWPSELSRMAPDIIVAPLQNNPFNVAKSNLKALEAACLGSAFMASVFVGSPYATYVSELGAVRAETTEDELYEKICALADPAIRKTAVNVTVEAVERDKLWAEGEPARDLFVGTLFKGMVTKGV